MLIKEMPGKNSWFLVLKTDLKCIIVSYSSAHFQTIDLAEFVLNRCIRFTEEDSTDGKDNRTDGEDSTDGADSTDSDHPEVEYDYTYLEDITVQKNQDETDQGDIESSKPVSLRGSDNHVLKWMVCLRNTLIGANLQCFQASRKEPHCSVAHHVNIYKRFQAIRPFVWLIMQMSFPTQKCKVWIRD